MTAAVGVISRSSGNECSWLVLESDETNLCWGYKGRNGPVSSEGGDDQHKPPQALKKGTPQRYG